jgi:Uma2 family endonuclease
LPSVCCTANTPGFTSYAGLRLTADEYFALPDNGERTELVHGVVVASPSPMPRHNHVAGEIFFQLRTFLDKNPIGMALMETDAHIGRGVTGGDLVYRAEVIFVERKNLPKNPNTPIRKPPNLMVEVVSDTSRRYDMTTKYRDYEQAGVHEYWVIDAERRSMRFFRLRRGKYVETRPTARRFQSKAVPGFSLNMTKVRAAFTPW